MPVQAKAPTVALAESCVPGADRPERLDFLAEHGVELEIEFDGSQDPENYSQHDVRIASVQCWRLHDVYPAHADPAKRREASRVIEQAIHFAVEVAAERVVTVCNYGFDESSLSGEEALQRSLECFRKLCDTAVRFERQILIEPLSPLRSATFTTPESVIELLAALDHPCFGLLVDTGHLSDWLLAGDPKKLSARTLEDHLLHLHSPIEALQLRGPGSGFPNPTWPIESWGRHLAKHHGTRLFSLEHRQPANLEATTLWLERLKAFVDSFPFE